MPAQGLAKTLTLSVSQSHLNPETSPQPLWRCSGLLSVGKGLWCACICHHHFHGPVFSQLHCTWLEVSFSVAEAKVSAVLTCGEY